MEKLLTTKEAAQRLGLSNATIIKHCKARILPNAQKVGTATGRGFWVIPESDLAQVPRPQRLGRRAKRRVRLTQPEYEALGLIVVDYWKRKPPILLCPTCRQQWRSWEWQCPTGCNAGAELPPPQAANPELKVARIAQGLSQKELARRLGVSTGAVSQWENRGTRPREAETLQAAIDLLGVNPWLPLNPTDREFSQKVANPQLRAARKAAGLTPAMLGERVGVAARTVRDWETRPKTPRPATRRKVAEVLGFDPWSEDDQELAE